ncbi:MAG TPA: FAD-dependent monooxygenase [Solirubrobacteraceae bacterium]|jgi:2-polyprenyl-6-methoxyphenol hydroxylase-like FAD-dependent oxidoreductase|nr:FAD-dependent monooxygenase [Solirubrobacteraceae bacterium]
MDEVLIVGGGIGGLATSIALSEAGHDVKVVEIQPDLQSSVLGVGIIQPVNALRALEMIGCAEACLEQGYPASKWMKMLDAEGEVVHEMPGDRIPGSDLPPLNGITRPRLHEILTARALDAGVEIEYGRTIDSLEDRGDRVEVVFDDASSAPFAVVVGADGVRSAVRRHVVPDARPAYNGQSAFRVTIPREPEIDCIVLQHGPSGSAGMVPLAEDLAYLFYNTAWDRDRRPADDELHVLLRERLAPFGGVTGRIRDRYVDERANIVLRPEEWLIAPPPWHRGRIVLIGDAVHTVTPHLGQGAAQAIEDGIVLAQALGAHDTVEAAFREYAERRYERCRLVVETGVAIGEWQQGRRPDLDERALRRRVLDAMLEPV